MSVAVVLLVLIIVIWLLTTPLRSAAAEDPSTSERAVLEARKEAKYREIRDAELDYRTGKLSEADWRVLDRSLRAEAIEILDRLDDLD